MTTRIALSVLIATLLTVCPPRLNHPVARRRLLADSWILRTGCHLNRPLRVPSSRSPHSGRRAVRWRWRKARRAKRRSGPTHPSRSNGVTNPAARTT